MKYRHCKSVSYDNLIKRAKMIDNLDQLDLTCEKEMENLRSTYGINPEYLKTQEILGNIRSKLSSMLS